MASRRPELVIYSPLMQATIVDEPLPVRRVYADGTVGPLMIGNWAWTAHAQTTLGHMAALVPESGVYRVLARRPGDGTAEERQIAVDFRIVKDRGAATEYVQQAALDGLLALVQQLRGERDFLRAELEARRAADFRASGA